ncbi:MAG: hypothetical protein GY871_10480 [Actinomycetales bacterium]|nr:hypothetical protein [Actinomycetales bacterium]MCP4894924.1 hypothetical protein [Actinomycetales bacterium]
MPEVALDFPRQWVEFVDPADDNQMIRADLTWLTSRWTCIFGRGCQGIDAARPDAGCCVHGAHFAEKKDRKRVARWVEKLTPELWENHDIGHKGGWTEKEDGASKTRVVDNACIFHNSEGFAGGYGCALHHLADQEGVSFIETKPEVCWQLPLRRGYEDLEYEDGSERLVVVLGEYDRRNWGEGGHDFQWYCTGNPEAHVATDPVYVSSRDEIIALIGQPAYDVLADLCDKREALLRANPTDAALAPHPADPVP